MTDARAYDVFAPQVLLDSLGLGRRFDDDETFFGGGHGLHLPGLVWFFQEQTVFLSN